MRGRWYWFMCLVKGHEWDYPTPRVRGCERCWRVFIEVENVWHEQKSIKPTEKDMEWARREIEQLRASGYEH